MSFHHFQINFQDIFTLTNIHKFQYGFDLKSAWKYMEKRAHSRTYRHQLKLHQLYINTKLSNLPEKFNEFPSKYMIRLIQSYWQGLNSELTHTEGLKNWSAMLWLIHNKAKETIDLKPVPANIRCFRRHMQGIVTNMSECYF